MKIRTKILGAFSVMLALVLAYQAASYLLTRKNIDSLAGMRSELEERRLTLEAKHLFVINVLSFSDQSLYPDNGYVNQRLYADKEFQNKLDELKQQLLKCGDPHQFEMLDAIRKGDELYSHEAVMYLANRRAEGAGGAAFRLGVVEDKEGAVYSAFDGIQKETVGMIADKERGLTIHDGVRVLFPSFKPIIEARQRVEGGGDLLWAELELNDTGHQMATAWRRYLLTGQERYVFVYRDLDALFNLRAARIGKGLADAMGFKEAVSALFKEAVRTYRSGDREGARKLMLKSFVSEQMLDSALDDMYANDLADFQSAYASLPPILDYALSFNRQLLIFMSCVGMLAMLSGSILISRMVRPINMLKDAAGKVAGGDWTQKVEVNSKDEIGGMAVSFNTMTEELKEADARLRESHEKYQTIVENVGAGVALIGQDMEMMGINDAMTSWFPQLSGADWPFCFCRYESCDIKAVEYGRRYESIIEISDQCELQYFRIVTSPVKGEDGQAAGAVQIFEDISLRLVGGLERSKLLAALERSNRELQDFAYIASHDLQSPLRKVVSFSQLLQSSLGDSLSGDDKENLDFLISGALHMQRLINDLLSYSRVTTKGKPLEPVGLKAQLKEVLDIGLAARLESTGGKIIVEGRLPDVMADPTQLYQLLQNIIDNALKYHRDEAPPEVTVSAARGRDGFVRVEVRDNGIGIDGQYYGKIFKMFQRLHGAEKYEGTGIGLSVCQRIVKRHGGDIGVCSIPGTGTTFWFTLPAMAETRRTDELMEAA